MAHGAHSIYYPNVYQLTKPTPNVMKITADMFRQAIGAFPTQDDLERCNCSDVGKMGHFQCGWCKAHKKPRFVCGCIYVRTNI